MTYIIYKKTGNFPKAWEKVTTIKNLFPNNSFLQKQYGLNDETIIKINHTKRANSKFKFKGYRTAFKHIFSGSIKEFEEFCLKYYQDNVWKKKEEKKDD
ncbi:hypothetical protein K8R33_02775 [archaeon]|nr:hypothetical protein [archaeon]